jgi:hypothetical protein
MKGEETRLAALTAPEPAPAATTPAKPAAKKT